MAAESILVDVLIKKATDFTLNIPTGWYQASEAMRLFPIQLALLEAKKSCCESLLENYGLRADLEIKSVLEEACKQFDQAELELERLQSNCCLRLWKKLLFPESLTRSLETVVKAYEDLPKLILEPETRQQFEQASLNQVAPLPFIQDPKYVPLETSVTAVQEALKRGNVVTIFGGPGQGKTSMAKYLALHYQNGRTQQSYPLKDTRDDGLPKSNLAPKKFVDRVFFLYCGPDASSKDLLLELWGCMGYELLSLTTKEDTLDRAKKPKQQFVEPKQQSKYEATLRRELMKRLSTQKVLIVLDDVRETALLEALLVQRPLVKYLITTPKPQLWGGATCVPILKPTDEQARQILENHVSASPTNVTLEVKAAMDVIIKKSNYNPLVLANVAMNVCGSKAFELREWESTIRYLEDLVEDENAKPAAVIFGRTYSKPTMRASINSKPTMRASITMALNSFSNQEQTLLFLASICESHPVPEVVFKIFFKKIHVSLARFDRCYENLTQNNFIKVESRKVPWSDIPQRSWSMHTIHQNFVGLIKSEEVASLFAKLLEHGIDSDIVAALLILFGQAPWRNQTAKRQGIPIHQFKIDSCGASPLLLTAIKEFVWLLQVDGDEEWEEQSYQSTKEVLHTYLHFGVLNDHEVSVLLDMQETIASTCEALHKMSISNITLGFSKVCQKILQVFVSILLPTHKIASQTLMRATQLLNNLSIYSSENAISIGLFPNAISRLVELLAIEDNHNLQASAAMTLDNLSMHVTENAIKIGSCPHAIDRLIKLLGEESSPHAQEFAARALGTISLEVNENAITIGSSPSAIKRLVELLKEEVFMDVRVHAAFALGSISAEVIANAIKVGSCPHAIDRLVKLLEENSSPKAQQRAAWTLGTISSKVMENAITIGSSPGAIHKLVELLREEVSVDVQVHAAWALGRISKEVIENAIKVGSCAHAIDRLIKLLTKESSPQAQESAAWVLAIISLKVNENAVTIGSSPGAIERLVELLREEVSMDVKVHAALTLGQISKEVIANAIKVGSCPHAIERLIKLLGEDSSPKAQQWAAWALGTISSKVVENAIIIGSSPGAIERLVELLREEVSMKVKVHAALTLGTISVTTNAMKVGSCPHAFDRLIKLLGEESSPKAQQYAAWALGTISCEVENAVTVGSSPGAIERLVELLREEVSLDVRVDVARTLGRISMEVVENAIRVGSCPHAIDRLIKLLGDESWPKAQQLAAWTLGTISVGVVENAAIIGSTPGAIERLVELLRKEISMDVQVEAAFTLGRISVKEATNAMKVGSCPHAIDRLVKLLGEDSSPKAQQRAAWTLGTISFEVVKNAVTIVSSPGAIERLVELLREEVSMGVRVEAAKALGEISKEVFANAIKVGSCPHVIDRLVKLLGEESSPKAQEYAGWTLRLISH